MSYKNFIFDLYGTLVDIHTDENKKGFWKRIAAILTEFGYPYQWEELKEEYEAQIQKQKRKLLKKHDVPEVDIAKVFVGICKKKGEKPKKSLIKYLATTFRVLSRDYLALYPDSKEILEILKKNGKKVYLLSNAQTLFTVAEIKQLGIWDYFDDVLISSEEHCKKPGAEFMRILMQRHDLKVSESIMIGNEFKSDVAVADAVGMDSYYIHTNISGKRTGEESATYADFKTGYLKLQEIKRIM